MIVKVVKGTLQYGSELWALKKRDMDKIEAFEVWIWIRGMKISWKNKVANEEVLRRVGERRNLKNAVI